VVKLSLKQTTGVQIKHQPGKMKWSCYTTVILPVKGKVKLTDQYPELQKVVHCGIQEVLQMTIVENAFPAFDSCLIMQGRLFWWVHKRMELTKSNSV
jgi:hypothetical protein